MLDANYFANDGGSLEQLFCDVKTAIPTTSSPPTGTTHPPTSPSTIPPTPDDVLKEILHNDVDFRHLTRDYDIKSDAEDGILRYEFYIVNKKKVTEHNRMYEAGETSYKMAVNQFSVAKPDELAPLALALPPPTPLNDAVQGIQRQKRQTRNDTVDFRHYMQPVVNQMNCGGCWAFAMTSTLEGFFAMNGHSIPPLSVQELLDCDRNVSTKYGVGNVGCGGGYFQVAAEYLQKKGATSEAEYSFVGKESSTCQLSSAAVIPRMKSFDSGYVSALNDSAYALLNTALEERVRRGPVAVGMAVNSNIYSYSEGIFDGECGTTINHAVVIVGFTPQYWIVRNSWGSSWGEAGHIRILRQPTDPCKLTRYWSQPIATATWTQGNAVVVPPMQSTTSVPNLQDCCDGACCEECTCNDDDDDDDDEYTISGMEKLRTTTITTDVNFGVDRAWKKEKQKQKTQKL
ncbi:hypothetical protein RB195_019752 [Necator americanus]|uniref:Papain family cysteine protease n=1 Tax=Necator americanus TaxID=51031 RepID=A0ABR1CIG3_NECAM